MRLLGKGDGVGFLQGNSRTFRRGGFAAGALLWASVMTGGAPSAHAGDVLYVLDASGSMVAPIRSSESVVDTLFRQAIRQLSADVSGVGLSGTKVGLIAFSHRTGSCTDIERVAPIEAASIAPIQSFLAFVQPRGATPLAAALVIAKEELRKAEPGTRLVLLSDGGENCGGDAEAAARDLKAAHPSTKIDIQFFSVGGAPVPPSIEAIARIGGGSVSRLNYDSALGIGFIPALPRVIPKSAGPRTLPASPSGPSADVAGAYYQIKVQSPVRIPDSAQIGPREGVDYPIYDPEERLPALRFGEKAPEKKEPAPKPAEQGPGLAASSARGNKAPDPTPSGLPLPLEVQNAPLPPSAGQML